MAPFAPASNERLTSTHSLLSPTPDFYCRIGETYTEAVSRHMNEQRCAAEERSLAVYINDINVVNSFYGVPLIRADDSGEPENEPQQQRPRRRWILAEACQNAFATGVQESGRIVEDITSMPNDFNIEPATQRASNKISSSSVTEPVTTASLSSPSINPQSTISEAEAAAPAANAIAVAESPSMPARFGRIIVKSQTAGCRFAIPIDVATGALLEWAFIDFGDGRDAITAVTAVLT
ncbi:hypothetical protein BZA05DRAFT_442805 [Tricharina praecox]|uniref:uncharacterized protein n=1 Tax=Tricharina praecox TaxID=43433 RepID=UPI002220139C|nr:uncharacterized protein BZA05DRAFT_442805 [Tricharina praecox]KAI5855146.1 hypothetical protein BZA05DRAFT_442805 [Tricharina praecox]